ncbi:hypothetical protein [Senegalia massiliensis]|uniref:Uncharacterized protein n=1 Tax=Senegalia massiliensis TaxID=1720316 RepID=A0A845QW40_9CLOT|nr:hypothetical protein [Senegalia massiliensis]NBI05368.1 hypothetical protein [Senegalia massiliensis]
MKKNISFVFTRILYILFGIYTSIVLFIVYKDIDSSFTFKFVVGYAFFAFFMIIYVPFITFYNLRKFKWTEIKKRLIRFISFFILFGTINYGFSYLFRSSDINFYNIFFTALGLSFGISFIDITFLRNKKS